MTMLTNVYRAGQYLSLDCEFVGLYDPANDHARHSLARVSIVNYHGAIVLDTFVAQRERIGDWRTWVSGVRPEDVQGGMSCHYDTLCRS
jgi:RNA exonuclease 4